ncbi:hypothetical protein GH714_001621 [Hevea brasiliensis]|uniref:RNase H type-1 domain-containing protein n=1 Tax=Hevea brasiliensis TaxID=3981 RepID=A0A6A6LYG0_HEVBR|nr:hypothetical protein GH714_001621 [Hevea brasiliensis]
MTIADGSGTPPTRLEGKYKSMFVCWILGLGSLIAWSTMLNVGEYYYSLFPKSYHPSRVLTLVYQPFALGTMALLAYNESKVDTRKRNIAGYILFTASTLMLLVLDLATAGRGGIGPFLGICAIVAVFGVSDAHVQGGMVGDLSFMCPEFIQSFLAGLAASGALTSALRLITKAAFEKARNGLRKGVVLFLAISTLLEFLCVLLYSFVFPKLPIVKYYRAKAASEGSKTVSADLAAAGIQTQEEVMQLPWMDDYVHMFSGTKNGYLTVCVLTVAPKGYNVSISHFTTSHENWHSDPVSVAWEKPKIGWTKLNFDGSCKGREGKASVGGVFRNHKAEFLLGYAESIGRTTNTIAEVAVLRRGPELVLENGWSNVWLEGDAKTFVEIVVKGREVKCAEMRRHVGDINMINRH